ncbi:MAG: phage tail tape measure protein [Desulfurellales bacterium]|nr:MAG: phage tail tape measure protein [Desulfurellales bacterium]
MTRKIAIRVELDDKPAEKKFSDMIRKFTAGAADMKAAFDLAVKPLSALQTGVKFVGEALFNAAAKATAFEKAVAQVASISDRAQFPLERIRDLSMDMVRLYGGTAESQAKALYEVISAGVTDAARATDTLNAANKLAIGGVTNTKVAVDGLTTVINTYAQKGLTASEATDAMFIAIRDGKTTAEQFSQSIGMVTPIAANAGVTFDELSAAVATLTARGISTSQAAEYLRAALSNITKPGKMAQATAKELGIEFSATALQSKGLARFLQDVVVNSGATQAQLSRLFRDVGGYTAVLSLMGDAGLKFNESLDHMTDKAGAADAAVAIMSDTLDFQIERMKGLGDAAQVGFGEAVAQSASARGVVALVGDELERLNVIFQDPEFKAALTNLIDDFIALGAAAIRTIDYIKDHWQGLALLSNPFTMIWGNLFTGDLITDKTPSYLDTLADKLDNIASHRDRIVDVKAAVDELMSGPTYKNTPAGGYSPLDPENPLNQGLADPAAFMIAGGDPGHKPPGTGKGKKPPLWQTRNKEREAEFFSGKYEGLPLDNIQRKLAAQTELEELEHAKRKLKIEKDYYNASKDAALENMQRRWQIQAAVAEEHNAGIAELSQYAQGMYAPFQGLQDLMSYSFGEMNTITLEAGDVLKSGLEVIAGAFASFFVQIGEALGGETFDGGKFFGGLIKNFGQMAISAATLIGVLGLIGALGVAPFAPFTAALPYAPVLLAAGIGAVAVGTKMAGGGGGTAKAIGGWGTGWGTGKFGPRDGERAGGSGSSGGRFSSSGSDSAGKIEKHYHIHYSGMVVGSEAEGGRALKKMIKRADALAGSFDGG